MATIAVIPLYNGPDCEVPQLYIGSSICLFLEIFLFAIYQLSLRCFSVYFLICPIMKAIYSVQLAVFYMGWAVYISYVYIDVSSCEQDLSFSDSVGLALVIYFLGSVLVKACCLSCFLCTLVTVVVSVTNNNQEGVYSRLEDKSS